MRKARRILIVDDNALNLKLAVAILRAKGYATIEASNGKDAIAKALSERPDLILLDVQMPEMDGIEVLSRLRSDPGTEAIPVAALTALAMHGDREKLAASGFDAYIAKPLDIKELTEKIEKLLEETPR